MKMVILGASGQIGTILFDAFIKKYEVTGTSRQSYPGFFQFDPFHDNWSVLGKPDVIINCIGQIESSRKFSFSRIHLELAKHIAGNRSLLGNPRVIQISALGASASHEVEFLRTKGEADDFLLQFPDVVLVRPSIVCSHRTMMVKKMLMLYKISQWMRGLVIVPNGFPERQIQPVMQQDLASIIDHLSNASVLPKILNVTGPERLSFRQIIKILFEVRGKKYRIFQVPKLWTDLLIKYGVSILLPDVINAQQYELLFKDNVADPSEAQKYLGTSLSHTKHFWMKEFSNYASH